jgi:aminopeptidase YwaD
MSSPFRFIRFLGLSVGAFLIAAPAVFPSAPSPSVARTAAPAVIADENIKKHIYFLASDDLAGRLPGAPGAEAAAKYIADHFREIGLKPTHGDGYFQEFPFVAKVRLGGANRLSFKRDGEAVAAKLDEDFRPLSFSSDTPIDDGEVIFAGFGINAAAEAQYDDYANLDVKDKIVLTLPYSPEGSSPRGRFGQFSTLRYKAVTARTKGARALLVVAEDDDFKTSRLAALRYDDAFGDAGIPAFVVSRQFANRLLGGTQKSAAALEKAIAGSMKPESFALADVRVSMRSEIVKEKALGKNVIGFLEGSDPALRNEIVVIGGHYDHLGLGGPNSLAPKEGEVHNGADDNASGTAGVMELARAFLSQKERPRRSLLFIAFSAEEKGLLGSAYYTDHPPQTPKQIVAMLNMDMIGRLREDKLLVQGVGTSPEWKPLAEKLNAAAKFSLTLNEDGYGPSDYSSFYKKQIPVLSFFTGNHEDYHRPSDDADKINFSGERRVLEFIYAIAQSVANQDVKPVYTKTKGEEGSMRMNNSFRVYVGSIPDYAASDVKGVKLSGVREGSPAAKAGLQANDIIVKLAGRDVQTVYDYVYVLQEMKPGQEVEVVVQRGSERLTFKLTPGQR